MWMKEWKLWIVGLSHKSTNVCKLRLLDSIGKFPPCFCFSLVSLSHFLLCILLPQFQVPSLPSDHNIHASSSLASFSSSRVKPIKLITAIDPDYGSWPFELASCRSLTWSVDFASLISHSQTSRLEGRPGRSYFAAPVGLKTLLGVLCLRTWLISGAPHAAADFLSYFRCANQLPCTRRSHQWVFEIFDLQSHRGHRYLGEVYMLCKMWRKYLKCKLT
jgi:hypothetical protein